MSKYYSNKICDSVYPRRALLPAAGPLNGYAVSLSLYAARGMETLGTLSLSPFPPPQPNPFLPLLHLKHRRKASPKPTTAYPAIRSHLFSDPWSPSDGNSRSRFQPKRQRKKPLSDDDARRIIKAKARYLSELRRNQGGWAQTPRWIRRTPEQMARYIEDDRNGHRYGKHVVAAIQKVRALAAQPEGSYDLREVMGSFVAKLTFREMCVVLKEQRGWRQVRDFFAWMKLQVEAFFPILSSFIQFCHAVCSLWYSGLS